MMWAKTKIIYGFLGILLIFSLYVTRINGLDPITATLIEQAEGMKGENFVQIATEVREKAQEEVPDKEQDKAQEKERENAQEKEGKVASPQMPKEQEAFFRSIDLSKYSIDVNYGSVEFRSFHGRVRKQRPQYPLAFSAVPTEEGPVLKVMPFRDFRNIYDMGSSAHDDVEKDYLSMLVHEGFHCYQMDHGMEGLVDEYQGQGKWLNAADRQVFYELVKRLDHDPEYQKLWCASMEGLMTWKKGGGRLDYDRAGLALEAYMDRSLSRDRSQLYHEQVQEMELLEGTARFMENLILAYYNKKLNGEFAGNFIQGTEKFYVSGSLKTAILCDQGHLGDLDFKKASSLEDCIR